jgi:hypothetical protein
MTKPKYEYIVKAKPKKKGFRTSTFSAQGDLYHAYQDSEKHHWNKRTAQNKLEFFKEKAWTQPSNEGGIPMKDAYNFRVLRRKIK